MKMRRVLKPADPSPASYPRNGQRSIAHPCRLETFVACTADLDLFDPFGIENLVGGETAVGIRVQDGIDDIATLSLQAAG